MLEKNDGTNNFQSDSVEERNDFQKYNKPRKPIFATILGLIIVVLVGAVLFINSSDVEQKVFNSLNSVTWGGDHVQKLNNLKLNVVNEDGTKTLYDSEDLALLIDDIAYYADKNATELSYEFKHDTLKNSVSYYVVSKDYKNDDEFNKDKGPILTLLQFNSKDDAVAAHATIKKYYDDNYTDASDKTNLPSMFVTGNNLIIARYTVTPDKGVEQDGIISLKKDLSDFTKNIFIPKFLR